MDTGVLSDFRDKTGWYHHLNYLKRCRAMSNNIETKKICTVLHVTEIKKENMRRSLGGTHTNWSAVQKANFLKTNHLIHFSNRNLYSRSQPNEKPHNFIYSFFCDVDNFFFVCEYIWWCDDETVGKKSISSETVMWANSFIWIGSFITFRSCIQIDAVKKFTINPWWSLMLAKTISLLSETTMGLW